MVVQGVERVETLSGEFYTIITSIIISSIIPPRIRDEPNTMIVSYAAIGHRIICHC